MFAAEMGVHLGRREFNLVGDTVNVASRITSGARPMHVLVDGALADRLAATHRVGPKESRALKGKAREVEVAELLGDPTEGRPEETR